MIKNVSTSSFLGEGGFGPVHKGFIDVNLRPGKLDAQAVAVKLLDLDGPQGHREWLVRYSDRLLSQSPSLLSSEFLIYIVLQIFADGSDISRSTSAPASGEADRLLLRRGA